MFEDNRSAFETILAEIHGALDKPLSDITREAIWKGLSGRMSLIEFARVRDLIFEELQRGDRPPRFGLPEIWAAKRRLRAGVPQPIEPKDNWQGDEWDIFANNHLLGYVLRQGRANHFYDARATKILVSAKHLWARDMREAAAEGMLPVDSGKAWFQEGMQRAEEAILRKDAA